MAAMSSVRIANMALSHIGARSTIESLDRSQRRGGGLQSVVRLLAGAVAGGVRLGLRPYAPPSPPTPKTRPISGRTATSGPPTASPRGASGTRPASRPTPCRYEVETDSNGEKSILTDMEDAVLVFTKLVAPTSFSRLFVEMLSRASPTTSRSP
jgi:hypothetical protein